MWEHIYTILAKKVVFRFHRLVFDSTCMAAAGNISAILHISAVVIQYVVQDLFSTNLTQETCATVDISDHATPTRRHKLDHTTIPTRTIAALIHLDGNGEVGIGYIFPSVCKISPKSKTRE